MAKNHYALSLQHSMDAVVVRLGKYFRRRGWSARSVGPLLVAKRLHCLRPHASMRDRLQRSDLASSVAMPFLATPMHASMAQQTISRSWLRHGHARLETITMRLI